MQLFSIGLYKLKIDGTKEKDANGNEIPAYTNENVAHFARVWTGLNLQNPRKNIEMAPSGAYREFHNYIDPLQMKATDHDIFPKPDLDGEFLGDGYPQCNMLPSKHFFRKGATYRYTGNPILSQNLI